MEYVTCDICIPASPSFFFPWKEEVALYSSSYKASHITECSLNYFIMNNNEYLTSVNASSGCLHKPNRIHNLKNKKREERKFNTRFVMIPGNITSQLHALKEGDKSSHAADVTLNRHTTWGGVKKESPPAVLRLWMGSVAWDRISSSPIYVDPQGEHLRPPRWAGPGACRNSPRGSGEDTDVEDASERVWEKLTHGWEKEKSAVSQLFIKYECVTKLNKHLTISSTFLKVYTFKLVKNYFLGELPWWSSD